MFSGSAFAALGAPAPGGGVLLSDGTGVQALNKVGGPSHSFGAAGSLRLPGPKQDEFQVAGMTVDAQGRLLVAGTLVFPRKKNPSPVLENGAPAFSPAALRILRFLPGGGLDPSFGHGGMVETDLGLAAPLGTDGAPLGTRAALQATGIAVAARGQIVVTGSAVGHLGASCVHDSFAPVAVAAGFVARFTEGGELDPGFGNGGLFGGHDMSENPLGAEALGDPVIGPGGAITYRSTQTYSCNPEASRRGVAQLTPAGQTAPAFGGQGTLVGSYVDIVGEPDGSVIALEEVPRRGSQPVRARLVEIAADGTPDEAFGEGGVATLKLAPSLGTTLDSLAVDRQGRIVVGGTLGENKDRSILLLRVSAAGRWEKKFGPGGVVATRVGELSEVDPSEIFFDSRGRLVTVHRGFDEKKGISGLLVARYVAGGGAAA